MEEIWKTIENYPDYQVSNLGRVKSFRSGKECILKAQINSSGYKILNLFLKKNKTFYVHKLVASAFLGKSNLQVNHINSNKLDNNVYNLEYVSHRENSSHRSLNKNFTSKYTGVSWKKHSNKWQCHITINGKKNHLGMFDSELDAHNAYKNALKENNLINKYS
jgi:hypothetical protein